MFFSARLEQVAEIYVKGSTAILHIVWTGFPVETAGCQRLRITVRKYNQGIDVLFHSLTVDGKRVNFGSSNMYEAAA